MVFLANGGLKTNVNKYKTLNVSEENMIRPKNVIYSLRAKKMQFTMPLTEIAFCCLRKTP